MKTTDLWRFEMLQRVREFGIANASAFPEQTAGNQLFAEVTAAVAEVEQSATNQSLGLNAVLVGTKGKAHLRDRLRDDLAMINRTARVLAHNTPGLDHKFRLPRTSGDQALLTAARVFATDAEPLREGFIKLEMPSDFLEELRALIADFEKAVNQKTAARGSHVEATVAIDTAVGRGVAATRQLDVIVRNKFRDDPSKLAAWAKASHTQQTSRATPTEPPKPAPPSQ